MLSSLLLVKKEKTKSLQFWYFSCLSVSIWTLTVTTMLQFEMGYF